MWDERPAGLRSGGKKQLLAFDDPHKKNGKTISIRMSHIHKKKIRTAKNRIENPISRLPIPETGLSAKA